MQAIAISKFGGPEVLVPVERPIPKPGKDEIVVRVRAAGVNRADLVQRVGKYPPPADAPQDIPGLEYAGEIVTLGDDVHDWKVSDKVYGLAGGGTYAECLVVHTRTAARMPENLSFVEAAALPEVYVTAYDAMVSQCGLQAGETVLISAVGSGVGTAAVQIASAIGATAIGTARTEAKIERARELGLEQGIVTKDGAFSKDVLNATNGLGVDVVLELVGGAYVAEDLVCAANKGRIIVVGLMAGAKIEADLGPLMRKRLTVRGTTLRMRPLEEKIMAAQLLARNLSPLFESKKLRPVIDKTFPLVDAAKAHAMMEANDTFGKVVLEV